MNDRRFEIEDLGELAGLPPDDPRRRTLEERPAVRARLKAYGEFMAPTDTAAREAMAEAEARLGTMLERELGVPIGGERAGAGPAAAPRDSRRSSWLARLLSPPMRPLVAAAVVVVVVAGAWLAVTRRGGEEAPLYRGTATPETPGGWPAAPVVETLPDGGVRLGWTPAPEADAYTVVFLTPGLVEIARVGDLRAAELVLDPGRLPAGLAPGSEVLWRVIALHGPDTVGSSPATAITIPDGKPPGG